MLSWIFNDGWTLIFISLKVELEWIRILFLQKLKTEVDRWHPVIILEKRVSADALSRNILIFPPFDVVKVFPHEWEELSFFIDFSWVNKIKSKDLNQYLHRDNPTPPWNSWLARSCRARRRRRVTWPPWVWAPPSRRCIIMRTRASWWSSSQWISKRENCL